MQFRNGWYHVTARGLNRQSIYANPPDRWHFLELVGEMSQRYGLEVQGESWAEVVRAVEAMRGQKWEAFAQRHGDVGLALALYVGRRCTGLTLRALGEVAGGMDYTAVSMAIKRFEQRLGREAELRRQAESLLEEKGGCQL